MGSQSQVERENVCPLSGWQQQKMSVNEFIFVVQVTSHGVKSIGDKSLKTVQNIRHKLEDKGQSPVGCVQSADPYGRLS